MKDEIRERKVFFFKLLRYNTLSLNLDYKNIQYKVSFRENYDNVLPQT